MIKQDYNMTLNYFQADITAKLNHLKDIIEQLEKIILEKDKEVNDQFFDIFKDWNNSSSVEAGRAWSRNTFFSNQMYASNLVTIYSFFEFTLAQFCKWSDVTGVSNNKLTSIKKGNDLQNYYEHIKSNLGIKSKKIEDLKTKINDFKQLRKLIIHNNINFIEENAKSFNKQKKYGIVKKMSKQGSVSLLENGHFEIKNKKILFEFCNLVEEFFIELTKELKAKINSLSNQHAKP